MKKANRKTVNDGNQANNLRDKQKDCFEVECAAPRSSRGNFIGKTVGTVAGIVVLVGIAVSPLFNAPARAEMDPALEALQLGSPPFANPNEVSSANTKKLRAVMQLSSGSYKTPNLGSGNFRQFRGWDATKPTPTSTPVPTTPPPVNPGPTLRARLGDQVQISFLNQIDDSMFPKTLVKDLPPGVSHAGCDETGKFDPMIGRIMPYPGDDKFPNCLHGSSTANIHFHGTHTSPDGLGDNVLVQVLPQLNQPDWTPTFNKLFDSGKIPQTWADMPAEYRTKQMAMIQSNLDLYEADQKMIAAGHWPQYLMGAFPNFFDIPDYDKATGAFNSGGNGVEAGQAPGTHWYHAHKHGSTSLHILNGLAGAFIIESSHEGGYDHVIRKYYGWGDTYGNHEKIFVFQQYDTIQNIERTNGSSVGPNPVLVNGMLTPTITMAPGEVQLWRLVNATEGNGGGTITRTLFQTAGFTFKQTAMDGVQLSPFNYSNQPFLNPNAPNGIPGGLTLAGGNRADLLVQAPATASANPIPFKSGGAILFYVKVAGTPVKPPAAGAFPDKDKWAAMPKFLNDLRLPGPGDAIDQASPLKFQWEDGRFGPGRAANPSAPFPPHFMISGKQFGQTGEVVDQCMPLDGLQDWILENYTTIAHPFHIHINPFQVVRIDTPTARDKYTSYAPGGDFIWQDVVAIPPAVISTNNDGQITSVTPGRVKIRQTYLDFTGTYVLHCHILAHEDRGMMQLVRVVPAKDYPKKCQDSVPEHH